MARAGAQGGARARRGRGESAAAREEAARQQYVRRHTIGRPHPDRARQFMPFAALRGYYDLVRDQEVVPEEERPLTEEEARELNELIGQVQRGAVVRCTYYADGAYRTCTGAVSQVDTIYRTLWIVRTAVPFDCVHALELL
ncbi:hypothetical protein [uncultured Adlercreutzia sp.]|uniref:hypothetical protein n=1 Tax=uncultured Adlercreutzia sp. TaxID=875803 RepID=UPI0025DE4095|nr:hypothetical protein [uncultured Adlercreutzia sp.]MCI9262090.1 YolD-like family protein [Eggerthellaceae bacterium]